MVDRREWVRDWVLEKKKKSPPRPPRPRGREGSPYYTIIVMLTNVPNSNESSRIKEQTE